MMSIVLDRHRYGYMSAVLRTGSDEPVCEESPYEWDEENKVLTLDRILHSSVVYPENYGFIPQTLCEDGDPLDVLILSNQKLLPGTIAYVRPICYMDMTDEKGKDEKLLAVLEKEPYFTHFKSINNISEHKLKEIIIYE